MVKIRQSEYLPQLSPTCDLPAGRVRDQLVGLHIDRQREDIVGASDFDAEAHSIGAGILTGEEHSCDEVAPAAFLAQKRGPFDFIRFDDRVNVTVQNRKYSAAEVFECFLVVGCGGLLHSFQNTWSPRCQLCTTSASGTASAARCAAIVRVARSSSSVGDRFSRIRRTKMWKLRRAKAGNSSSRMPVGSPRKCW